MGNNQAFTDFERLVIEDYDDGVLTVARLNRHGRRYAGMDIDYGGKADLETKDGFDVEEVMVKTLFPDKFNTLYAGKNKNIDEYVWDDEYWDAIHDICNDVEESWGWK